MKSHYYAPGRKNHWKDGRENDWKLSFDVKTANHIVLLNRVTVGYTK